MIRLDIPCELQTIHMKCHVFSLKNNNENKIKLVMLSLQLQLLLRHSLFAVALIKIFKS